MNNELSLEGIKKQINLFIDYKAKLYNECRRYLNLIEKQSKFNECITADMETLSESNSKCKYTIYSLVSSDKIKKNFLFRSFIEILELSVICRVCYSPDGKYIAYSGNGILRVYSYENNNYVYQYLIQRTGKENNYIRSLAFHPSESLIVTASEDKYIRVFDFRNKSMISSLDAGGQINDMKFTKNGKFFVCVACDIHSAIYDGESFQLISELKYRTPEECFGTCVSISPDDKYIAVGYSDRTLVVFSFESNDIVFQKDLEKEVIYSTLFYNNGRSIVCGFECGSICSYDILTDFKKLHKTFEICRHSDMILSMTYDTRNNVLITGSRDKNIGFTDIDSKEMLYTISMHDNSVLSVDLSPTGGYLCSGSGDKSIKIISFSQSQKK